MCCLTSAIWENFESCGLWSAVFLPDFILSVASLPTPPAVTVAQRPQGIAGGFGHQADDAALGSHGHPLPVAAAASALFSLCRRSSNRLAPELRPRIAGARLRSRRSACGFARSYGSTIVTNQWPLSQAFLTDCGSKVE